VRRGQSPGSERCAQVRELSAVSNFGHGVLGQRAHGSASVFASTDRSIGLDHRADPRGRTRRPIWTGCHRLEADTATRQRQRVRSDCEVSWIFWLGRHVSALGSASRTQSTGMPDLRARQYTRMMQAAAWPRKARDEFRDLLAGDVVQSSLQPAVTVAGGGSIGRPVDGRREWERSDGMLAPSPSELTSRPMRHVLGST
jgi:hypothetical protein